ncbi:hypothetical protein K9M78_01695 [Candidatus Bipolaricaulota bacterium]|nr:hypothetical protein [Candidatus Bipolaricaulota bacterium]
MAKNKRRFDYENLSELRQEIKRKSYSLPLCDDVDLLSEQVEVGGKVIPNSLCLNPMEGHDADANGGPSALTFRRYRRYAEGGAGIIWLEATAVTEKGKSHPGQLCLSEESVPGFAQLNREIKKAARKYHGDGDGPLTVLQLTHAGRNSAPEGEVEPVIAKHSELLDEEFDIAPDYPVVSDEDLAKIKRDFINAAELAARAGFDAVDVKACHGSLIHELLFSYENSSSKYRGPVENRIQLLKGVISEVKSKKPGMILACRLSVYDDVPYPDGWGVSKSVDVSPDLTDPIRLLEELREGGLEILNVALGNPFYDSFLEQPFDRSLAGQELPDRDPLEAISTNFDVTAEIGEEFPGLLKVGGGISWLREFFPNGAAAFMKEGAIDVMGAARLALANPSFAREILTDDGLNEENLCIACDACSQMMSDGVEAGCLIRDGEMYGPVYRKGRKIREQ